MTLQPQAQPPAPEEKIKWPYLKQKHLAKSYQKTAK